MKTLKLTELTKEKVDAYFKENYAMDIETKTGTIYHIYKLSNGKYICESQFCHNVRAMTKEMKRVFC